MRYFICLAVTAALLATAATAQADWLHRSYYSMRRDFHRNNAWPEPFIWPDQQAVCAPFAVMVQNGWRLQNTLGPHHFREGTSELTDAGQLKVTWILTEAPAPYRTIFVERGATPQATASRIRTVQTAAARIVPDAAAVVMETNIPARGAPADQIDATTRQWLNSVPAPRLPSTSGGGSSSSSGGSSSSSQ